MTSPHEPGREPAVDEEARRASAAEASRPGAPATDLPPAAPAAQPQGHQPPTAVGGSTRAFPLADGPGWSDTSRSVSPGRSVHEPTTVLPGAGRQGSAPQRPAAARSEARPGTTRPVAARARRARLTWKRIDPWSVFLFTLVASVFLGIALVVAVAVLYAVLGALGVTESLNQLYAEVTGGDLATEALLTSGRVLGFATVLALVNVVFLTLLATLGALLYNLCASFTGGLEFTFGERD